jgi:hypothetical protein
MQLVWSLIVAWAMVASAGPHGPRDHAHHTGISVAPAFHHPLRQRELPAVLGPFVAPDRAAIVIPPGIAIIRFIATTSIVVDRTATTAHARAPPAA